MYTFSARLLLTIMLLFVLMAQTKHDGEGAVPQSSSADHGANLETQRAAMRKLDFLVGKWSGEGRIFRSTGETVSFVQTEDVQYKIDGLILMIEGVGRTKSEAKVALHAFALITFDDQQNAYRMRAFNDGRWMETELNPLEQGRGFSWGFALGEARTNSLLRMTESGAWTESHEIRTGSQPPRKFMELTVFPTK